MASTSSCPEDINSTDCLLRLLLQRMDDHNKEFSWDPITFGFTAPIGIIAALFAAFTIYQATIAAGQGSRKSNRRAIGEWADNTTKRWDWNELYRVSTAETPILTTKNVEYLSEDLYWKKEVKPPIYHSRMKLRIWASIIMKPFLKDEATSQASLEMLSRDPSAASWLKFLDRIGLNYSTLRGVKLKKHVADYLPPDLLAVPAYGQVGFIIAAAAAAGATWELDVRSEYPTIISPNFQFEFRQHQTFGTVGAFSNYNYGHRTLSRPTIEQLLSAVNQADGRVYFCSPFRTHSVIGVRFTKIDVLSLDALGDSSRLFDRRIARNRCDQSHSNCLCGSRTLLVSKTDKHRLTWLFMADLPPRPPPIFPSAQIQNIDIIIVLALHSKFWASLDTKRKLTSVSQNTKLPNLIPGLEKWYEKNRYLSPDDSALAATLTKLDDSIKGKIADEAEGNLRLSNRLSEDPGRVSLVREVLEMSIKFLYNIEDFKAWLDRSEKIKQQYLKVLILQQLLQIEKYLNRYKEAKLLCAIYSLRTTTLMLLDAKCAIDDRTFGYSAGEEGECILWDKRLETNQPEHDISARYFETLKRLSQLLSNFRDAMLDEWKENSRDEDPERLVQIKTLLKTHVTPLKHLIGIRIYPNLWDKYSRIKEPLLVLMGVLETCRQSMLDNITFKDSLQTETSKPPEKGKKGEPSKQARKEDIEGKKSSEDALRDVLIWKYILLAMLFYTAPDNSELLRSSVWERVVPII